VPNRKQTKNWHKPVAACLTSEALHVAAIFTINISSRNGF